MRKHLMLRAIGMALVLWAAAFSLSWAADIRSGQGVRLNSGERVSGNLYGASNSVTLSGETAGDAVVAGGNVVVQGRVGQDVLAAGGTIDALGPVGGDVRVAGGNINVANTVGGDVAAAGGAVHVLSGSSVGGDVLVWSGDVAIDGSVNGAVLVRGGAVRVDGLVRNGLDVTSTGPVVIGRNAVIGGDVTYRSPQTIVIENGATVNGRVVRQNLPQSMNQGIEQGVKDFVALLSLLSLLALLVAGLLGAWFFPVLSHEVLSVAMARPWRSLGWGLVFLILVPIVAAVLALLVIGWYVAAFLMLVYMLFLLIAYVYAGILLGAWIFKLYRRSPDLVVDWVSALAGIVLLYVIGFIPVIGWLIGFLLMLAVLGAMIDFFSTRARGAMMAQEGRP